MDEETHVDKRLIVEYEYLEADTAQYHAYIVAVPSTTNQEQYSFFFECQYGKKGGATQKSAKSPTTYAAAKRLFDQTIASKRRPGNERTYLYVSNTPPPDLYMVDSVTKSRIIQSRTSVSTSTGPDAKTVMAITEPNWIGVVAEKPLINVICSANEITSKENASLTGLSNGVAEDAKTIGSGIELYGYELDGVFYVANVHDEKNPSSVMGRRLQKLAKLIKDLDIQNIKLCKFAVNGERKQQIVDSATFDRKAIFIAADRPGNSPIIMYPS